MKPMLQASSLTKDFGGKKGIFDVNISLYPGEIVGFVGPNGAGKSTTISLLCGNIYPDNGNVEIFDQPVSPTSVYEIMPKIGILLSEPTIEERFTPKRLFTESEQLLGKTTAWADISRELDLDVDKQISKLSLGNKKKVGIVMALMHNPELVIMDEPTSGIDPVVVDKFGTLLRVVAKRGGAVILSSHDLHEIQDVCDRVIMIKDGSILLDKPIESLLKDAKRKFTITNPSSSLRAEIHKYFGESSASPTSSFVIQTEEYRRMIDLLKKHGCYDFLIENPSLEEMFAEYYL